MSCWIMMWLILTAPHGPVEKVYIRDIHIRTSNVFDNPEFHAWYFQWANHLHVKTSESFVRNELLLKEGDVLDPDLLKESERNLRKYGFLSSATIEVRPVDNSAADLYVSTEDQWTLKINLSFKKSKGSRTYDLGFGESNFLGTGKRIGFKVENDVERRTYTGRYSDPHFLNTQLRLNLNVSDSTDGYHHAGGLALPLYAESARWAYAVAWDALKKDETLYLESEEVARQQLRTTASSLTFQHVWGRPYRKVLAGLYAGYSENVHPGDPVILAPEYADREEIVRNLYPPDHRFMQYGPTAGINYQHYTTRTYLDGYGITEDLPYGPVFNTALLFTENAEGNNYAELIVGGRMATASAPSRYMAVTADVGIRRQSGVWNNVLFHSYACAYLQSGPSSMLFFRSPRRTLAAAFSATLSRDVDTPFQLSLGEDEGLRGYRFKSFVGTNRLLLNVEERVFTPVENRLFTLAVVPFLDTGGVWGGGSNWSSGLSTGIGLRIGIKKLQRNQVVRIDFAWPLINATDHGVSVSFASGQVFRAIP